MSTFSNAISAVFRLRVLAPLVIFSLAAGGAYFMVASAPKTKMRAPEVIRQTVETLTAVKSNHRVVVSVMGTVTAARKIALDSQVTGKVVSVSPNFVPGGYFEAGQEILTIDPNDYELAVREVEAEVTEAEYDLKVELGYQKVSAREWDLLKGSSKGTDAEAELALRKPHLEKAKADLRAARAKLRQAQINLERTHVKAPFAAMVESKDTDIGGAISAQGILATLVGTDEFWIQASVPVDRLDWIHIPSTGQAVGSTVRILIGSGVKKNVREGRVVRLLPSLEDEGRMARVLISVKDPLNLEGRPGENPLLLGSYVSVRIEGDMLENVFAIPRNAYRDNSRVWVLTEAGTLDIRPLKPLWRDEDTVIVDQGLAPGDAIVTTDLAAPVQGMRLKSATPTPSGIEARAEEGGNG